MRVTTISGRMWTVRAKSEKGDDVFVAVIAQTPEQALASFRDQYPGHNVGSVNDMLAAAVVIPA